MPGGLLAEAEEIRGARRCRHRSGCLQYAVAGTWPPMCKNHGANLGSVQSRQAAVRVIEERIAVRFAEILAGLATRPAVAPGKVHHAAWQDRDERRPLSDYPRLPPGSCGLAAPLVAAYYPELAVATGTLEWSVDGTRFVMDHFWCVRADGEVIDPTFDPPPGAGGVIYRPRTGPGVPGGS